MIIEWIEWANEDKSNNKSIKTELKFESNLQLALENFI